MANDLPVSRSEIWKSGLLGPVDVDFGAMGPGPHTLEQKAQCNHYFWKVWLHKLTDREYSVIEQWPNLPADTLRGMNRKLDRSILEMAFFVGPPFTSYCDIYERRMGEWRKDPHGIELIKEYCKALEQAARFEQATLEHDGAIDCDVRVMAPLQRPHDYLFREQAVIDWGMMRGRIQTFQKETGAGTIAEIWPFIKSEIEKEPAAFPAIGGRLSDLERFLRYSEAADDILFPRSNLSRVLRWRPRQFVKQWMAFGKGRKPVSYGHDIGKMGKALKHKPSEKTSVP